MSDRLDELLDRYGKMPKSVKDLIAIAYLRELATSLDLSKIEGSGTVYRLIPSKMDYARWQAVFANYKGRLKIGFGNLPYVAFSVKGLPDPITALLTLCRDYEKIMKNSVDK